MAVVFGRLLVGAVPPAVNQNMSQKDQTARASNFTDNDRTPRGRVKARTCERGERENERLKD